MLGSGGSGPGTGGTTPGAGHSGTAGDGSDEAGRGGSAGKPTVNGGSSGATSGDGGMMDAAGAPETGGESAAGGTAGGAGSGGTAGSGAVGGTTGGGGSAGSGTAGSGTAGSAGSGGSPLASGCAKLSVPIDDAGDKAHFVISLTSPVDMSGATISMHFYVQAGTGGTIFDYVQDSGYRFFSVPAAMRPALSTAGTWSTLTWNIGAQPDSAPATGIVKTSIKRIGIEINGASSTSWSNPTIVYVDSITVVTPTLSFTLDAASSVSTTPTNTDVGGQVMWLNNDPSDTNAGAVTLGWQATCP
ncbi:MAG: hypothetical protein WDO74_26620 [Pseudomonadota bacterium]